MVNQITSPRHNDEPQSEKPTYKPSQWEIQHGFIRDGVFHRPDFVVLRNGKLIDLDGNWCSSYRYQQAFHIMLHLQAVSDDCYTVEPISWQPMTDYNVIFENDREKA